MKIERFTAILVVITFVSSFIPVAFAQNNAILGEIRSTDKVYIKSSAGEWIPAGATYPIFQDTEIRTEKGTASLFFKDGSRLDLSKDTTAEITGVISSYSLNLQKGVIAFNIRSSASLKIVTPSGTVSAGKQSLVQTVSSSKERLLGVVSVTEKGTEVRSISGRITVNMTGAEKVISSGENIFAGADSNYRVYRTQAVVAGSEAAASSSWIAPAVIGGVIVTGAVIVSVESFRGHDRRVASPSGF